MQKIHDAVDGTVTKLRTTSRDAGRVSILVDKKVIATLPRRQVTDLEITVGEAWTPQLASRVADAVDADVAYRRSIHLLARRAWGSRELAERLQKNGYTATAIEITIARLTEKGWLNDTDYARGIAEGAARKGQTGPRRIRHKLYQKRLPPDLIDEAVVRATDQRDLVEDARKLVLKKLKTSAMQKADIVTRKRRLYGLLARRGYETETIHTLLDNLPELTDEHH